MVQGRQHGDAVAALTVTKPASPALAGTEWVDTVLAGVVLASRKRSAAIRCTARRCTARRCTARRCTAGLAESELPGSGFARSLRARPGLAGS